jgi:hypothetical protein
VHVEGKIALIARVSDVEKAEETLRANDITIMSLSEIKKHF